MPQPGLTTIVSDFSHQQTIERLIARIEARGMTVFARIDHAAGAAAVGKELRPTELIIFGNAKAGTPLMQSDQTMGIDLPLKALVYQDAHGSVKLAYDDPAWLAGRHSLDAKVDAVISGMTAMLQAITSDAAKAS